MAAKLLVLENGKAVERPPEDLSERRDRPAWLDVWQPQEADLRLLQEELDLHPLAIEDAVQKRERPKIEQFEKHYFIVFYAIDEPEPDVIRMHQVALFVLANAVVTVRGEDFAARAEVEKRFREGRLQTSGLVLHALLDTIVDGYFGVVDGFGDRVELLESMILEGRRTKDYETTLRELFELKRDLVRLRQVIAPEREVLQVLTRGDIEELREPGRRLYFQDVYDHIVRAVEEIDTFRDLTSNVIDAQLAAASNRLNEVMKVLTAVATILLVLSVVTSFFGMNFDFLPFGSPPVFWAVMVATVAASVALFMWFRARDWI
ncbi:MAG TPA: magnesium/cobalt transporter CorA [Candidatus Limnocylindria bacterium]|nr:magnesium/cobalt transporter CorA [Candidatus Limnocylindria bacterium]